MSKIMNQIVGKISCFAFAAVATASVSVAIPRVALAVPGQGSQSLANMDDVSESLNAEEEDIGKYLIKASGEAVPHCFEPVGGSARPYTSTINPNMVRYFESTGKVRVTLGGC